MNSLVWERLTSFASIEDPKKQLLIPDYNHWQESLAEETELLTRNSVIHHLGSVTHLLSLLLQHGFSLLSHWVHAWSG